MESPRTATASSPTSFREWLVELPRWKKVAVGVGIAVMITGGVLTLMSSGSAPANPTGATGPDGALTVGLVPDNYPGGTGTTTAAEEPAAKGVFRLGFSFVAGFCIGSFVRAMVKVATIAFGFWLVFTMLLTYVGVLQVDWNAISGLWDKFAAAVESEWGSFQTFMTGSLPAAGLAVTGLAVGLKRN